MQADICICIQKVQVFFDTKLLMTNVGQILHSMGNSYFVQWDTNASFSEGRTVMPRLPG